MKNNVIMAIDPGVNRLGLAVASDRGKLLAAEVISEDPRADLSKRLRHLGLEVGDRLDRFRPSLVLLEKTWPSSNRAMAAVRRAALVCRRTVTERRIPVVEIPVTTVRQQVAGWGWATKLETAQVVAALYPELQLYLRQDRAWKERYFQNLFDAVALLVYERKSRTRPRQSISSPAP